MATASSSLTLGLLSGSLSCLAWSCQVFSGLVWSWLVLSWLVLSCPALLCSRLKKTPNIFSFFLGRRVAHNTCCLNLSRVFRVSCSCPWKTRSNRRMRQDHKQANTDDREMHPVTTEHLDLSCSETLLQPELAVIIQCHCRKLCHSCNACSAKQWVGDAHDSQILRILEHLFAC